MPWKAHQQHQGVHGAVGMEVPVLVLLLRPISIGIVSGVVAMEGQ